MGNYVIFFVFFFMFLFVGVVRENRWWENYFNIYDVNKKIFLYSVIMIIVWVFDSFFNSGYEIR